MTKNIKKGEKFGKLTVIKEVECYYPPKGRRLRQFKIQCDCGVIKNVTIKNLLYSKTQSCGCSYLLKPLKIGDIIGQLTVLSDTIVVNNTKKRNCLCSCGKEALKPEYNLQKKKIKCCGCTTMGKHSKIHGLSNTRIYGIWSKMKRRCENKKDKAFYLYGEKGIKVCDEWQDIRIFSSWALDNGYRDNLTIERLKSHLDYCPSNCIWADRITQNNNTSRNNFEVVNGENLTLSQISRKYGINKNTIKKRHSSGKRGAELIAPVDKRFSRGKKI